MPNLSEKDRRELLSSPYVTKVTHGQVNFTPEFKEKVVELCLKGINPTDAFNRLGINSLFFLDGYPKKCAARWKKILQKEGPKGLVERRGKNSTGRPKRTFDSNDVKSLQRRLQELEAENYILKKLSALAEEKSEKKKGSK
jgi:transposase-like protein